MERIAAILAVFVLLMNGRHAELRLIGGPKLMTVTAEALPPVSIENQRLLLGPLRYLGGWSLTADREEFGGISSMRIDGEGRVTALSDTGDLSTFLAGKPESSGIISTQPPFADEYDNPKWRWDSESMAWDPVTRRSWVGFELDNRICRYAPDFAQPERCARPREIRGWPKTTGMESLARLPDGRFLAIAEEAPSPDGGGHDALLFAGDPADPATPAPERLSYDGPEGYLPTDALAIGHDRLLVMNRRVTLLEGFTGILTLVDLSQVRAGAVLKGRVIARLAAPMPHDNFEALAMSWEGSAPILWVASDDNHLFFQRSLLLKFAMPRQWFE